MSTQNKIITYYIGKTKKTIKVTAEQGDKIIKRMEVEPDGSIALGDDYIQIKSIKGVTVANDDDLNTDKVKKLRKALKAKAHYCPKCVGIGFNQFYSKNDEELREWVVGCEVKFGLCDCQVDTKKSFGVDEDDFEWAHLDD